MCKSNRNNTSGKLRDSLPLAGTWYEERCVGCDIKQLLLTRYSTVSWCGHLLLCKRRDIENRRKISLAVQLERLVATRKRSQLDCTVDDSPTPFIVFRPTSYSSSGSVVAIRMSVRCVCNIRCCPPVGT